MPDQQQLAKNRLWDNIALAMLLLGLALLAASFLPLDWTRQWQWSAEDSARYDRVSLEYHRSSFQTPERAGRTAADLQAYRDRLRGEFEALESKLTRAQQQPQRWSRFLLWTGCCFVAGGALLTKSRSP